MKNPGSFNSVPATPDLRLRPCAPPLRRGPWARAPLPAAAPRRPRGAAPRSPRGPPEPARPRGRCLGAAQKFTARPDPSAAHGPGSRAPGPAARPRLRFQGRGQRAPHPGARRPARDAPSSTSLACGLGGLRAGRGAPDGIAGSPRALTCAAHSTGVAGRLGREVSVAPAAGGSLCGPAPAHARTSSPLLA